MKTRYRSLDFLGFPNYRVGTNGTVWSKHNRYRWKAGLWRKMKPNAYQSSGYLYVNLYNPVGHRFMIHYLVLRAFVGPCPPGHVARHFPDRRKSNNKLRNLSWTTREQNMLDKYYHGTDNRGEKNGRAKNGPKEIREMKILLASNKMTAVAIAAKFGITRSTLHRIKTGRLWSHIL